MKLVIRGSIFFLMLFLVQGFTFDKVDYREAKNKNVCKNLRNEMLIYCIFVDTKTTSPWTEFDIKTTIDSLSLARKWLIEQSKKYNVPLSIKTDYFIGKDFTTVNKNLSNGSVANSVVTPNFKKGLKEINDWADFIARKVGGTFNITQKDGIAEMKSPKNKERLIAYLRDEYKVESVALLFFVNNYYKTDISLQVNTMGTDDIEFAIVSYKYPAEIAHNVLHLYGAADMYKTLYRRNDKKIKQLSQKCPNDIMQDCYGKNIREMEISEYTRYLIGWNETITPQWEEFFTDKSRNF
jgi:hypothetical protein